MQGNGSTATSEATAGNTFFLSAAVGTDTQRGNKIFQILDYSVTDKHKSVLYRDNNASDITAAIAGRWASTSAVNAIEIYTSVNQFASGSTFYLYGIVS